jgi:hypothetical protein
MLIVFFWEAIVVVYFHLTDTLGKGGVRRREGGTDEVAQVKNL